MEYEDQIEDQIKAAVQQNGDLGFYLVILKRDGITSSTAATHPMIPRRHLYEHLLATLTDDLKTDGFSVEEIAQAITKVESRPR